ncbi:MAG: lactonase family protein [Bacteroidales bacterium]|nr:lactonase family protein [Bacteroidales bacterium]
MKKTFILFGAALSIFLGCTRQSAPLTLLVGTYTDTGSKGIYSYTFDQKTGDSSPLAVTDIQNPSFLAVSPDNKMVYAVSEQQTGSVSAFDFNASDGTLTFKNSRPTNGKDPCHVTIVGKEVVATNYSSGSMTIFPLDSEGKLGPGTWLNYFGNGPDPIRQEGSHTHSSKVSPDGKYLFVVDLGGDYIYRYPVSDGKINSIKHFKVMVPEGEGPRHFDFSPDGRFMYIVTELGGKVLVYEYNDGNPNLIQKVEADPKHARGSADIHFSPDGKFLYASNRLEGDGLAIFSQNKKTGLLTWVGYQETGIHPRNFTVSPDGRFVLVACRDSDKVQVFSRNKKTGLLTDTGKDIVLPHPVFVKLVQAE